MEKSVLDRVRDIVSESSGIDLKNVTAEKTLKELEFDSLDGVELCMQVEQEFKVVFDDEEMEKLDTVQSIVDLVNKKLEKSNE